MSWTRLDDGFDAHEKILGLGDGVRGDARRYVWARILIYTNRHGAASVPWNIGEVIPRASKPFLRDCVELGLLDQDDDGKIIVHDWPLYADVAVEVKVAYCLTRDENMSANDIVKMIGGRRNDVLKAVAAQRRGTEGGSQPGITEPPNPVSGNHIGNQRGGSQSGTRATGPLPTRPDPKEETRAAAATTPREPAGPNPPLDPNTAAAAELHNLLDQLGAGNELRTLAFTAGERAIRCAHEAITRGDTNPSGLLRRMLEDGDNPPAPTITLPPPPPCPLCEIGGGKHAAGCARGLPIDPEAL